MELGTLIKPIIGNDRLFNIVIPTYEGSHKLEVIINSFLSQTDNNWQLTIVSDGKEPETEQIISKYDYDNISYYHMNHRHNDWGHTPREFGLVQSNSEWTILTGFDNYYVPTFIEQFKKAASSNHTVDMIFCDFILNHIRDGYPYNGYINSKLEVNYIDIGNFATRTSLLKEVGFKWRNYAADWTLVQHLMTQIENRNTVIVKIPQTLYIHN